MTKSGRKFERVVSVAAIWCAIVGGAAAQISDLEQEKSWFFLQKIAKDIEELVAPVIEKNGFGCWIPINEKNVTIKPAICWTVMS
jgi:hypothetical protein